MRAIYSIAMRLASDCKRVAWRTATHPRSENFVRTAGYLGAVASTVYFFFEYTKWSEPRRWCHVPNFRLGYFQYDISPYILAFLLIGGIFVYSFQVLRADANVGHRFTVLTLIYAMSTVVFALIYFTFGITIEAGDTAGAVSQNAADYLYFSLMNSLTFHETKGFVECESLRFIVFFQKICGPLFGFFYLNLATVSITSHIDGEVEGKRRRGNH